MGTAGSTPYLGLEIYPVAGKKNRYRYLATDRFGGNPDQKALLAEGEFSETMIRSVLRKMESMYGNKPGLAVVTRPAGAFSKEIKELKSRLEKAGIESTRVLSGGVCLGIELAAHYPEDWGKQTVLRFGKKLPDHGGRPFAFRLDEKWFGTLVPVRPSSCAAISVRQCGIRVSILEISDGVTEELAVAESVYSPAVRGRKIPGEEELYRLIGKVLRNAGFMPEEIGWAVCSSDQGEGKYPLLACTDETCIQRVSAGGTWRTLMRRAFPHAAVIDLGLKGAVRGAAAYSAYLHGRTLTDLALPCTLHPIRVSNIDGRFSVTAIEECTTVPSLKKAEFTAPKWKSENVVLMITEGNHKDPRDDERFMSFRVKGVKPDEDGDVRIAVTVEVDGEGAVKLRSVERASDGGALEWEAL